MRLAVLSDVHGNLPALEAVLAEVASLEVDAIVCCGDTVAGPFPQECLGRLQLAGARFLRGNADGFSPRAPAGTWEWIAAQLDAESLRFLEELPITFELGGVRFCHGSPRDEDEILTMVSPDERFRAALEGVEERLVVGGHTHTQFVRELDDGRRFANAGSVGMPYEHRAGAYWAVAGGVELEHRFTPYAVDAAVAAIRGTTCPFAEELCELLLEPKDPDEVAAFFESVAT
jgi:putative phosphoesterase